eukprot:CAMPEP_0197007146 /NCGR_PEP_ID=MMETSP1380-20130617/39228_1 /TAXON_ID=5936 /ORGANISM="Euplotes crassus, Strain CT5" /LENGTH=87 /DNA_ID=CAMNT_0042427103 /DNA_START=165 /DNA_END=425 /DNA_ORIENTATION=+
MRYIDEEFIRHLSEEQRMVKLMDQDPESFPQRVKGEPLVRYFERQYKGILPQIVEDFNFNALPEPESTTIDDEQGAEDSALKHFKAK